MSLEEEEEEEAFKTGSKIQPTTPLVIPAQAGIYSEYNSLPALVQSIFAE